MKIVKVVQPDKSNIFYQLNSLYETFKHVKNQEKLTFDLTDITRANFRNLHCRYRKGNKKFL